MDRSAPGNSSNRRFIVHPRNPGEKAVYARMLKTEDGTITIQKGEPAPAKEAEVKPEPIPEADGDGEVDQEGESENNAGPAEAAEADPPPSAGRPQRASQAPETAGAASPDKKQKKKKKSLARSRALAIHDVLCAYYERILAVLALYWRMRRRKCILSVFMMYSTRILHVSECRIHVHVFRTYSLCILGVLCSVLKTP